MTSTEDTINQPQELYVPNLDKSVFYYTLFAIPLSLRYDSTDLASLLLDPTHGMRAALTVSPTLSLGPPNATYIITQIRASAYLDLHDLALTAPGRTVIAVHGLYGYAQGASVTGLPPDQRFYAGGSGSVRGYNFQSVGPQFADAQYLDTTPQAAQATLGPNFSENTPVGGVAVDAGGIELRQRVGLNYGFAVFADAGRIGQTALPFSGKYAVGLGTGVRYYTPIGPLRSGYRFPDAPFAAAEQRSFRSVYRPGTVLLMPRSLRITLIVVAVPVLLVALLWVALLTVGNTVWGREHIESLVAYLTRDHVRLHGLGGELPDRPTLQKLELADEQGIWLTAQNLEAAWDPWALLERRVAVRSAHAQRIDWLRLPVSHSHNARAPSIPDIDVHEATADSVSLSAALAGTASILNVHASAHAAQPHRRLQLKAIAGDPAEWGGYLFAAAGF